MRESNASLEVHLANLSHILVEIWETPYLKYRILHSLLSGTDYIVCATHYFPYQIFDVSIQVWKGLDLFPTTRASPKDEDEMWN